jgi:hypothetical protein
MIRKSTVFHLTIILLIFVFGISLAEEGMYPISEIHKLSLKEKGLEMEVEELYNPDGISLIDGICKVGGCTGSFISYDGLIFTNHHCAYGAIQRASTPEKDYLQDGFISHDRSHEIPARGYEVRITESYKDVSNEVLSVVDDEMDLGERTKAIEKKIKEIIAQAEEDYPGMRAEVSEMFIGKTYVLFLYTYLKDIRLVYAPPRSIGNFGGEADNWMWPRHTGDFSLMRVYVAPDGSSADYSPDNVPYTPKRILKVAPEGVNEEDFVFILGYPGRTYRHRTASYLAYLEEVRMPYVVDLYEWQISVMEEMSKKSRDVSLKHKSRIKGLANTMKNYKGKLQGMRRLDLVEKKKKEEESLQKFIEADASRKENYGMLLQEIADIYQENRDRAEFSFGLSYLRRSSNLFGIAYTLHEASIERQKEDIDREWGYMERNFSRTKIRLELGLRNYYEPTDKISFKEMLMRAARLPEDQQIPAVQEIIGQDESEKAIDDFIEKAYAQSRLSDLQFVREAFEKAEKGNIDFKDPFIELAKKLYPTYKEQEEIGEARSGALDKLYAKLVDVKREFLGTEFIPDANSTLRLTFGHIRGYSPADAISSYPITTVNGILEKYTGEEPFDAPQKLLDLIRNRDFGQFEHPVLKSVPTGILYDMDTTGGNSGSPVLNARGEIVGLNFDRAFEATINDFAWNQAYSRSIGVDIRYVLWIIQKFGGADHLLKEMNLLQ